MLTLRLLVLLCKGVDVMRLARMPIEECPGGEPLATLQQLPMGLVRAKRRADDAACAGGRIVLQ